MHILKSSRDTKFFHWIKLITITGSSQTIIQALTLLSGILVVRLLSIQEYALYTVTNSIMAAMIMLSDGGISSGVLAEGGKVWQDKYRLGRVVATGLKLRKNFAIYSLLVCIPILSYLLFQHGATYITIILIAISLIPAFLAALSDLLLEAAPKLYQDISPLQKNQILVGTGRLIATATLFVFPFTFIAILANGIPRILGNIKLRQLSDKYTIPQKESDPEIRKTILKIVSKVLPGTIYYTISGQITVFIISFFGNTTSLGQVGALGRLTMVLAVFSSMFNILIVPRFSRLKNEFQLLITTYFKIIVLNIIFLLGVVLLVFAFSSNLLYILGKQYQNLQLELTLSIAGGCASVLVGYNYSLSASKGWILSPLLSIPIGIVSIIVGISIFNFSTLRGVLYYSLFLEMILIVVSTIFCVYKIIELKKIDV